MRKLLYGLVALAALGGGVVAQDPDPDGPGKLEITTEDPAKLPEGSYAKFSVKTAFKTGDKIDWEIAPAPVRAERIGTVFVVNGVKGTTYTLKVWVVNTSGGKNGRWDKGVVEYTFGGKTPDPVVPPPPPTPVDPPKDAKYYFLVVRPEGVKTPELTKALAAPEWATLKAKGHLVKDKTVSEAALLGVDVGGVSLPAVATLVVAPDGKSSVIVRPAIPLPAGDAILKLQELK